MRCAGALQHACMQSPAHLPRMHRPRISPISPCSFLSEEEASVFIGQGKGKYIQFKVRLARLAFTSPPSIPHLASTSPPPSPFHALPFPSTPFHLLLIHAARERRDIGRDIGICSVSSRLSSHKSYYVG